MPPRAVILLTSKWTFSLYLSFRFFMNPEALMVSCLSSVHTKTSLKRMPLASPLIRVWKFSGSTKRESTGAKGREMSRSCVRPFISDVR